MIRRVAETSALADPAHFLVSFNVCGRDGVAVTNNPIDQARVVKTRSSRGVVCWLLGAAFLGMFLLVATIQGQYGSQTIFKDFLENTFKISDDDADVYLARARTFCLGAGIVFVVAGFVRRFGSGLGRR
jgi:hypothetical protein